MESLPPEEWAQLMQPSAHARYDTLSVFVITRPIPHPIRKAVWRGSGAQESFQSSCLKYPMNYHGSQQWILVRGSDVTLLMLCLPIYLPG